ncbi:hypothetical protein AB833_26450 [Chromatiales bacterium (ex Bugula neritina AB1)]|nr:hypothetical protein AB833_26450 [Chromatiales bacterium (ex Bugula neritina AB1)]
MTEKPHHDLTLHLCRNYALCNEQAERIIEEVLAFFSESPDELIQRRHREMQREGLTNPEIFKALITEIQTHRFPASIISERQIRRIIYG